MFLWVLFGITLLLDICAPGNTFTACLLFGSIAALIAQYLMRPSKPEPDNVIYITHTQETYTPPVQEVKEEKEEEEVIDAEYTVVDWQDVTPADPQNPQLP